MKFDIEKLKQVAVPASEKDRKEAEDRYENREARRYSSLIALAVRRELRLKGITQQAFAEQLGFSAQYLGKILKGKENLTLETIGKLERVLGHPLLEVLPVGEKTIASQMTVCMIRFANDYESSFAKAPSRVNSFARKQS